MQLAKQSWKAGAYNPDIDGLKKLVDALRQLSRIGDALSLKVKATSCAPWVAAFIQWCIGVNPSVYMENGRSVIEQPSSRITLIASTDSNCPCLEITVQKSLGSPSELISAAGDKHCEMRMVSIERYGQWLLQELDMDSGIIWRTTMQALPYCLKLVLRCLRVSKVKSCIKLRQIKQLLNPPCVEEEEILEMIPCPFPNDSIISAMLSRVLNSSQVIELISLKDGLLVTDLPFVKKYIDGRKKSCTRTPCRCSNICKGDNGGNFLRRLSYILADVLALSLFDFPETLLVALRGGISQVSTFRNAVFSILKQSQSEPVVCPITEILQYAVRLVGHDVDNMNNRVISSFRGQVVYLKIFESNRLEKRGYLMINWAPGLLQYDGENYSSGLSEPLSNLHQDTLSSQGSLTVNIPRNLVPGQRLVWQVSPGDDILLINMGIQDSIHGLRHISKTPFRVLLNLEYSFFMETCPHPSDSELAQPNNLLTYTGPLEPFRSGEDDHHPGQINVIAVKDNDGLRILSLASGSYQPYVIQRGAYLACCVDICQRIGCQTIVC